MSLWENIAAFSELTGISGREQPVRDVLCKKLEQLGLPFEMDRVGNLIIHKAGTKAGPKVLVAAHMDEPGFLVRWIEKDGRVRLATVGEIGKTMMAGRRVLIGKSKVPGVIGVKPTHLLNQEQRGKAAQTKELYADIGADGAEQAEKAISVGDEAVWENRFEFFGEKLCKGKGLDSRIPCAVLLELLSRPTEVGFTAVFTVRGVTDCGGMSAAVFANRPEMVITLGGAPAADGFGFSGEKQLCCLGEGPVVPFMEKAMVYDRALYESAFAVAEERGLSCQNKRMVTPAGESKAAQISGEGARTAALLLPVRYLGTPVCTAHQEDVQSMTELAEGLLERLARL